MTGTGGTPDKAAGSAVEMAIGQQDLGRGSKGRGAVEAAEREGGQDATSRGEEKVGRRMRSGG